jgi:hypothetical protein
VSEGRGMPPVECLAVVLAHGISQKATPAAAGIVTSSSATSSSAPAAQLSEGSHPTPLPGSTILRLQVIVQENGDAHIVPLPVSKVVSAPWNCYC